MFRLHISLAILLLLGIVSGCGGTRTTNAPAQSLAAAPAATSTHTPTAEPPTPTSATTPLLPKDTPAPPPTNTDTVAQVTNIVDGDTIDVLINGATYRVRYILVNTPERGQPFYSEATAANAALVSGQTVTLVKDVSETDRYGRLLRYVYLADGTFVNAELVRQGYAQIATFPPDVAMEAEIRAAQAEAIASGSGLWAAPSPVAPVITEPVVESADSPPSDNPNDDQCDPAYPDVCIPPISVSGDLDCGEVPQYARFRVLPPDPHGFDGNDNDGTGCESN
jgi:micrococcal nuclease